MREQGIRVSSDHRLRALLLGPETLGRKSLGQKAADIWDYEWGAQMAGFRSERSKRLKECILFSGRPGLKGMMCVKS